MRLLDRRAARVFAPLVVCLSLSILGVVTACWLTSQAAILRSVLLSFISAIFFVRFAFMLLVFVPRAVPWWEAVCTGGGMCLLPAIFVISSTGAPPMSWLDLPAALLHIIGSLLTTASEVQRWRWKPHHPGRLYVDGLFALAKHINYTGEVLCFMGWSLLTTSLTTLLVPLGFALALRVAYAPDLDVHLRRRYANDPRFAQWQTLPCMLPTARDVGCPLYASVAVVAVAALARAAELAAS